LLRARVEPVSPSPQQSPSPLSNALDFQAAPIDRLQDVRPTGGRYSLQAAGLYFSFHDQGVEPDAEAQFLGGVFFG